ncbi:MAG: EF-hand domain-containing protein [Thermochromatium sp.]
MTIGTITSGLGTISAKPSAAASAIPRDDQGQTQTLERLFSSLDTEGKGYLDANDFEIAFAALGLGQAGQTSDGTLTLPGVEEVVAALDMDGDGKVSANDLTAGMRSLTDSLSFLQGCAERLGAEAMSLAQTFTRQLADEEAETQRTTDAATETSVDHEQTRPNLLVMRRLTQIVGASGSSSRVKESSDSLSLVV